MFTRLHVPFGQRKYGYGFPLPVGQLSNDFQDMTLDDVKSHVGWDGSEDTFKDRVTASGWTSNLLAFRDRPLLKLADGRFLVLDLQFLFESSSAGLSWSLMNALNSSDKRLRFLETWGDLFEQYVRNLLTHYYPDQAIAHTYPGGQIDALLSVGTDVVIFEVKSGFLSDTAKGSRDMNTVDLALRKKYVTDSAGKRVGVRQLAATSEALLRNKVANVSVHGRIFPVLVGEDPILQIPGMNIYLNDIFSEVRGFAREPLSEPVCSMRAMLCSRTLPSNPTMLRPAFFDFQRVQTLRRLSEREVIEINHIIKQGAPEIRSALAGVRVDAPFW